MGGLTFRASAADILERLELATATHQGRRGGVSGEPGQCLTGGTGEAVRAVEGHCVDYGMGMLSSGDDCIAPLDRGVEATRWSLDVQLSAANNRDLLRAQSGFHNVCGHVHLACSSARACRRVAA